MRKLILLCVILLTGCKETPVATPAAHNDEAPAPVSTNRIDIPEKVRQNLGITFAKVESRRVAATLRVPGRFERIPSAKREYRAMVPGRIELLVKQYDVVEAGQLLVRVDSPEWRRLQHEAVEAEGEIKVAEAMAEVAVATKTENDKAVSMLQERVTALAEVNTRRSELETELAMAKNKGPRLDAEARAAKVKLAEAREHYTSKLNTLSSLVGIAVKDLMQAAAGAEEPAAVPTPPLWRTIAAIEIRANQPGTVESLSLTSGGWADTAELMLTTVDPSQIRFRATALQADLKKLKDGAPASVVPPRGVQSAPGDAVAGKVAISLEASAETRTIELIITPEKLAPWVRAGVSGLAEIVTDESGELEAAIPVAAVLQDELTKVFFRRDPENKDKVIRVEGDFGISDGRWIAVNSGVMIGDEVVLDGVYELKLTGSGKTSGGGHFHADGTWHPDGTPEPGSKK